MANYKDYIISANKYSGYKIKIIDENGRVIYVKSYPTLFGGTILTSDIKDAKIYNSYDEAIEVAQALGPYQDNGYEQWTPEDRQYINTDLKTFHKPIEMFSIALEDQEDIREFQRRCPDVEMSDDPNNELYGVPIAKNRKGKLQALKAAIYAERN